MAETWNGSCSVNIYKVEELAWQLINTILPRSFCSHFCLAGGCFKSLIHHRQPNDIDLWPASEHDRIKLLEELVNQGASIESDLEFNTILQRAGTPRIEVTKKCPASLDICLSHFDLVLSCIGVEFDLGKLVDSHIDIDVSQDIAKQEVTVVDRLQPHKYNLLTLNRMSRYADELGFYVPSSAIERLWRIAYAGSTTEERQELLNAASLTLSDVPAGFNIERQFIDGHPPERCRPFTEVELDALKAKLLMHRNVTAKRGKNEVPKAVYIIGFAGSGKTTVIRKVIRQLGLHLFEKIVNLDMDVLRSGHAQFNALLEGSRVDKNEHKREIYKGLIPWFNEGADVERSLYKIPESVVKLILQDRCDFMLPIHSKDSLDFMKYASESFGYRPYLIEVRVSVAVAQERALRRARATGRYTPKQYIEESQEELAELLQLGKELVTRYNGVVATFDNDLGGGARLFKCAHLN